jgi:hypothetical protein
VLCCYGTTNSTTAWVGQPWQEGKKSSGPVKSKKKEQREFRFYVVSSNLAGIETDNCEHEVKKKEKIPTAKASCGSAFLVLRRSFFLLPGFLSLQAGHYLLDGRPCRTTYVPKGGSSRLPGWCLCLVPCACWFLGASCSVFDCNMSPAERASRQDLFWQDACESAGWQVGLERGKREGKKKRESLDSTGPLQNTTNLSPTVQESIVARLSAGGYDEDAGSRAEGERHTP